MRIYLGGPMFTQADGEYNLRLATKLRNQGYSVYCPNESEPINDKTHTNVTAKMIYEFDIAALEDANLLVCQVSEDSGTNWEAGYMDCLSRRVDPSRYYGIVGLATDMRLRSLPDLNRTGVDNQALHINALVIGGLQSSLGVYLDQEALFARLAEIRSERES
ncbi:hypothetical protein BH09CHL1_BH09CHL1_31200 [soil metagenome]